MNYKLMFALGLILIPTSSQAAWFGPDNYEECVLEKMKGQNKAMIQTARKACERQFPNKHATNSKLTKLQSGEASNVVCDHNGVPIILFFDQKNMKFNMYGVQGTIVSVSKDFLYSKVFLPELEDLHIKIQISSGILTLNSQKWKNAIYLFCEEAN
jgi:hypothetical protein